MKLIERKQEDLNLHGRFAFARNGKMERVNEPGKKQQDGGHFFSLKKAIDLKSTKCKSSWYENIYIYLHSGLQIVTCGPSFSNIDISSYRFFL